MRLLFLPAISDVILSFHDDFLHHLSCGTSESISNSFGYLLCKALRTLHDEFIVNNGQKLSLKQWQNMPQERFSILFKATAHSTLDDAGIAALNAMVLSPSSD